MSEDLMQEIRKRFEIVNTAEAADRVLFLEDIRFTYNIENAQWPEDVRNKRKGRPCITSPKLRKYLAQVANRERDMRMAMKVRPVDNYGDPKIAEIYDGILRHIEYQSKADEVYTHGGLYALAGGWGYWRVRSDYVPDDFVQEILIDKIENPLSTWLDPRGNYCFIREGLTKDEFEAQYPGAEYVDMKNTGSNGDAYALWYEKDKIFITEYFKKEFYKKIIAKVLVANGTIQIIEITSEITPEFLTAQGFRVLDTRTYQSPRIKWYKASGHEVLEERTLPGAEIPVVQVEGDFVNVDGKIFKRSFMRDGKDPQRMYNYWLSAMTETVALQPKAPYIVSTDQIEGLEKYWDNGNEGNHFYLPVNPTSGDRPRREQPPQVPAGALTMLNIADKDISDTLGLYEASFGQVSNEKSGVAIRNRAQRGDLTTYHFPDNLKRSILQTLRICIDWIPTIYDTERIVRMRGEDGKTSTVEINKTVMLGGKPLILNDLSVGRYDIEGDIKNYSNRRQEAVEQMTYVLQTTPQIAPALLPIIAKYEDWPGADEMKEAIDKYIAATMPQQKPPQEQGVPSEEILNQPTMGEGEPQ